MAELRSTGWVAPDIPVATRAVGGGLPRRVRAPRALGMAVGAICIAAALHQHGAPAWLWLWLAIHAAVWPHVAYSFSSRNAHPHKAEKWNLVADCALAAFWLPPMGFNLLPSALALTMVTMDAIAVGGAALLWRGLAAQATGIAAGCLAVGIHTELVPTLPTVVASLPVLVTYPLTVGLVMYRLSRRLVERGHELRDANARLQALSHTDALTDVGNRRLFDQRLQEEWHRARRHGWSVALVMIDVDHFKRFNDRHGHQEGDACLRRVAQSLQGCARRASDLVARYGGEEFVLILPHTALDDAAIVAQRCLAAIDEALIPHGDSPTAANVTISIGVAAVRLDAASDGDVARLVRAADAALYRAKSGGRHRVERG
jgi:diguanylate cyclase